MFPTASSIIYYNEAGEVTGWDSTYWDEAPWEDDDPYDAVYGYRPDVDPDTCQHGDATMLPGAGAQCDICDTIVIGPHDEMGFM